MVFWLKLNFLHDEIYFPYENIYQTSHRWAGEPFHCLNCGHMYSMPVIRDNGLHQLFYTPRLYIQLRLDNVCQEG